MNASEVVKHLMPELEDAIDYFAQRADAEYSTESASPTGNEEMRLQVSLIRLRNELNTMQSRELIPKPSHSPAVAEPVAWTVTNRPKFGWIDGAPSALHLSNAEANGWIVKLAYSHPPQPAGVPAEVMAAAADVEFYMRAIEKEDSKAVHCAALISKFLKGGA